jgi:tetratricopeptide (TPR) repeat protein
MYYGNLGAVFKTQNKLEDAISCYRRALRMDENCIEACFNLALASEEKNKDEAIRYYEQTLRLNPGHAKAIHNLANLYFEKGNMLKNAGDPDASLVWYRKAMQIKPDFRKPYMAMYHQLQHLCEWQKIEPMNVTIDRITRTELEQGVRTSEMPLMNLLRHVNPALNYSVAASWGKAISDSIQDVVNTHPLPLSKGEYLLDEGLRLYNNPT